MKTGDTEAELENLSEMVEKQLEGYATEQGR